MKQHEDHVMLHNILQIISTMNEWQGYDNLDCIVEVTANSEQIFSENDFQS